VIAVKLGIVQLPLYGEIMYQLLQTQASICVSMQLVEDMFVGNMRGSLLMQVSPMPPGGRQT